MKPDRIIVVRHPRARELMRELYKDFSRTHDASSLWGCVTPR